MKYLRSFLPAVIIASTVVAEEPIAAKYFAQKVTTDNGYTQALLLPDRTLEYVVAFTTVNDESNPYTWQVPANIKDNKIDYLVVAGGGGGGAGSKNGGGGGGGAGGMLTGTLTDISENTLSIVVGAGGLGGVYNSTSSKRMPAVNGGDSSVTGGEISIVALGGGAGGSAYSQQVANGSNGGGGGGGAGTSDNAAPNPTTGGQGEQGQGYAGGARTTTTSHTQGAGGGGAGAVGNSISSSSSYGNGGNGLSSLITGKEIWYAGGGGGANNATTARYGKGGTGGGGSGVNYTSKRNIPSTAGATNTGGGGGAGRGTYQASPGGSGIVVLRYALNDDDFQGIVIDSTTEKFGSPDITYGLYPILPSSGEYTFPRFSDVSEGVRAVCVGCELWNKDETELIDEYADDYRDNQSTADTVQYAIGENKGVVLKWKFIKEYYVSTVASCERGSLVEDKSGWYRAGDTIQVAITSMDNFISWGGWGDGSQRSIEPSKTITVVAAPMTITAYFTAHNKDNLLLNGDFEMNNNPSAQNSIINGTGNLTAGNWERISSGYTSYNSGLVTTTAEKNSKVQSYSGLSAIICSSSASTATRKNGTIKCTVHVPCSGLYDLSFMNDTGYNDPGMKGLKWNVDIDLITSNNAKTNELVNLLQKANMSWHQENFKVRIPRGGLYTLQFSVDRYSIAKDPEASASDGTNASSAFDNIEFKLDKRFGFALMVR